MSASDPVTKLIGIGPVTARFLETKKVMTVGDLSKVTPGQFSLNNLSIFIKRAKEYLEDKSPIDLSSPSVIDSKLFLVIGGDGIEDKKNPLPPLPAPSFSVPTVSTAAHEEIETKILIENHTWFEHKIRIPCKNELDVDLKEAIIYELSIEAYNRVSLVCAWIKDDGVSEKLCSMTFSPQFILFFNPSLPVLELSITSDDWKCIENQHTIENVLYETNLIVVFNQNKL